MIFVSSCLAGKKCRYDGKSQEVSSLRRLVEEEKAVDGCPELLGGLLVPRLPAEIQGTHVRNQRGIDVTSAYEKGAEAALHLYQQYHCSCAVLKEKSPSCGCHWIYDGTFTGQLIRGEGITAELFRKNGIAVMNEKEWESKKNECL